MDKTTLESCRQLVCDAGKRLLREGLVSRTWGNVSMRINDVEMLITPSGKHYDDLSPDDIVLVNIYTLKYSGLIKPSSELKLHCQIYKNRPLIRAVIHTHQLYASIIASARRDVPIIDPLHQTILGGLVIKAAPYALPNTRKITVSTEQAIGTSRAALMSNHGAVCIGTDLDGAFEVALTLEKACAAYLDSEKPSRYSTSPTTQLPANSTSKSNNDEKILEKEVFSGNNDIQVVAGFVNQNGHFFYLPKPTLLSEVINDNFIACSPALLPNAMKMLFAKRKEIKAILVTHHQYASQVSGEIPAILDDQAQLLGVSIRLAASESDIIYALKHRYAALLSDGKSICVGSNLAEAKVAAQLLEKTAHAYLAAQPIGGAKAINKIEAWLMQLFYQYKYGKAGK